MIKKYTLILFQSQTFIWKQIVIFLLFDGWNSFPYTRYCEPTLKSAFCLCVMLTVDFIFWNDACDLQSFAISLMQHFGNGHIIHHRTDPYVFSHNMHDYDLCVMCTTDMLNVLFHWSIKFSMKIILANAFIK